MRRGEWNPEGNVPESEKKGPEQETREPGSERSSLDLLRSSSFARKFRGFVAGLSLLGAAQGEARVPDRSEGVTAVGSAEAGADDEADMNARAGTAAGELSSLKIERKIIREKKGEWKIEGARQNIFEKTPDGRWMINPWSILSGVEVDLGRESEIAEKVNFTVSHRYGTAFEEARAKYPKDYEMVRDYIASDLRRDVVRDLSLLDSGRGESGGPASGTAFAGEGGGDGEGDEGGAGDREAEKGAASSDWLDSDEHVDVKITNVEVVAAASPEGPQGKGPKTLDQQDPENIELAKKRGDEAKKALLPELKKAGVDVAEFEEAFDHVRPEEIIFSDNEQKALAALATNESGATPREQITNLIIRYNNGEIKDENVRSQMETMLDGKRFVRMTVQSEAKKPREMKIPIPVIPLAVGSWYLLRRRRRQPTSESGAGREGAESGWTPPEIPDAIRERIENNPLPPDELRDYEPGTPEYGVRVRELEEQVVVDDLDVYVDDKPTRKRGIDYRRMLEKMFDVSDRFADENDREIHLAYELLQAWQRHDINRDFEALRGRVPHDKLQIGYSYVTDKEQIGWARLHARMMINLVDQKIQLQAGGEVGVDFTVLVEKMADRLRERRAKRLELGEKNRA